MIIRPSWRECFTSPNFYQTDAGKFFQANDSKVMVDSAGMAWVFHFNSVTLMELPHEMRDLAVCLLAAADEIEGVES